MIYSVFDVESFSHVCLALTATRIQYLAIEIARNREGITKRLYDKATMERRTAKVRNKETVKDEGNVTHAFAEISVNS